MLTKLERKIGKYAIKGLIKYLLIGMVIGAFIDMISSYSSLNLIQYLTLEPYMIIHRLQIWRIFTWVLIPYFSIAGIWNMIWAALLIYIYYSFGQLLEASIGTFAFNVYVFGGMIFTVIGAFITYAYYALVVGNPFAVNIGSYVTTHYLLLSIFLAIALCYPEQKVYLYFLIPIKMKWMAVVYGVFILIELIQFPTMAHTIVVVASLLNFIIFFLMTRKYRGGRVFSTGTQRSFRREMGSNNSAFGDAFASAKNATRNAKDKVRADAQRSSNNQITRHKCAICGKTELSDPDLEFRFCSKCNGNYEYCQNHLFTHKHIG